MANMGSYTFCCSELTPFVLLLGFRQTSVRTPKKRMEPTSPCKRKRCHPLLTLVQIGWRMLQLYNFSASLGRFMCPGLPVVPAELMVRRPPMLTRNERLLVTYGSFA